MTIHPSAMKITEENIKLMSIDIGVDVKELEHLKGYYAIWEIDKPWRYITPDEFREHYYFFTSENPRGFRVIMLKEAFNA